ncbi:hypothetical protein Mapa_016371 [Marchantia paleacea]|nr:hypothetical protein Mapa_016371 [Marchantia paleacea]
MVIEEDYVYGVAVAVVMLGVPLWHNMGECRKGRLVQVLFFRWWLVCALMIFLSLLFSVLVGVAGYVLANIPPPRTALLSTDCKIISKGVDIRSTKVCDGDLPHISQGVRGFSTPAKYKCSLDYYWTSVFKVEFTPHASQSAVQAGAEAPREALPLKCRPTFGVAWRTKETYEVNRTYPCKYSPTDLKTVEIAEHTTENCSIQQPSNFEILKQLWFLLVYSENAVFSRSSKTTLLFTKVAASVGLGTFYSIIVIYFTSFIRRTTSHFYSYSRRGESSDLDAAFFEARLQLVILFTASLFCLIFLSNHYIDDDMDIALLIGALYRKFGF